MSAPESAPYPYLAYASVSVNVHVQEYTALGAQVFGDKGRVVLDVEGTNHAIVNIFLRRAALVRLIDTATEALSELDAATDDAATDHVASEDSSTGDSTAPAA